ncbi:C39 family peptidase [Luteolibacter pohnpeiensis]|uniref:C39 family peptidase n=1 Tax=Luteolibacter pohnpeiensis TaxID=454153 RepID=A0A934VXD0_9BACT|nr:C39 family peptidase [Luteolibacter pohnpeiensis]MBK1883703.1 C39 family peptidase [Luteolibacter pohnpeiensis]
MYAELRDFPQAFHRIESALEMQPEDSWIHVQHASILELADRYEDALEAGRTAFNLRPNYRAAVLKYVDILVHLGCDEEAIQVLEKVVAETQHAFFSVRLQGLYSEKEDHVSALKCLDLIEQRMPMMEKSYQQWIVGRRADFAYMAGDIDSCLEWCDRKDDGFHKRVAQNLRSPNARTKSRVRLQVPFVRQHNSTCAPATLAAISCFWGKNHDHLEIAEAICHEGTPWHKERRWAEEHGFVTREFRITHEVVVALIDRGLPFTLTTEYITSGHLQACIGYDDRLGVILLRDPTVRHFGEMILESLIEEHPIAGPRGMVLVPREESQRLDGIHFPDEAAYNEFHQLLVALDGHDRMAVEDGLCRLRTVAPDSPLIHEAAYRKAVWDGDPQGQLDEANFLLEIAPKMGRNQLRRCNALNRLGRRNELIAYLESITAEKNSDPVFESELGELLLEDARQLEQAQYHLKKALRRRRRESRCYDSLARCMSKLRLLKEEAMLRRVASGFSPDFEPYARGYFDVCRAVNRTDEGLIFLEQRANQVATKSSNPWLTWAEALDDLHHPEQAATVLKRAMALMPDDGNLLLHSGKMMCRWGGESRIQGLEFMEQARSKVPDRVWLTETAKVAAIQGERAKALKSWEELVRLQPLSIDAWRGLAGATADEYDEEAAIALLKEATNRNPDWLPLLHLQAEWLVDTKEGPLEVLGRIIEMDPKDRWALRERAFRRVNVNDLVGAEHDAREALELAPWEPASHGTLGKVLEKTGRIRDAIHHYREALHLEIDYIQAAHYWSQLASDKSQELELIEFLEAEMHQQVSTGEIVLTYQEIACPVLDAATLLAQLKAFGEERPDLWQTFVAIIEQAVTMQADDVALQQADAFVERFPLMPRAWTELARVQRLAGSRESELRAAAKAFELSPGWGTAATSYAEVLEKSGMLEQAIAVLSETCRLNPQGASTYGYLADVHRRKGDHEQALKCLLEAVRYIPNYTWAWSTACKWAVVDGKKQVMVEALDAASQKYGHLTRWWRSAAAAWQDLEETDRMVAAIYSGLKLSPADPTLRDSLALHFFEESKYPEALAACESVGNEVKPPVNLRGRRAWILMHSGQAVEGLAEMKDLLDQEPEYAWGFGELASWHEGRREWAEVAAICRRWQRADAANARVLGLLGFAERELGNCEGAKNAFARANALNPEYTFATRQLMDLQMRDGELEAAAATLKHLQHYSPSPYVICDAIELELKRKDRKAALRQAETLTSDPGADLEVMNWAFTLFNDNRSGLAWKRWLKSKVKAGPLVAPGALASYLKMLAGEKMIATGLKLIRKEPSNSPARITAWRVMIRSMEQRNAVRKLRRWAVKRYPELRENAMLWNAIGERAVTLGDSDFGLQWLADWRDRSQDVNDATLLHLAVLQIGLKKDRETNFRVAESLTEESLTLFPRGPNSNAHRALSAFLLAWRGETESAQKQLDCCDFTNLSDFYRLTGEAAKALLAGANDKQIEAREYFRNFISVFHKYSDVCSGEIRSAAETAMASLVPSTKGKVSTLRRLWALQSPSKTSWWKPVSEIQPRYVIILLIVVLRACSAMYGHH